MNGPTLLFLIVNAVALLLLPRRLAPLPLLIGACYVPADLALDLGSVSFSVLRILIVVGVMRAAVRRERIEGPINTLDWLLIAWGAWACFSSLFHEEGALENRLGMVCDTLGAYFLIRVFCRSIDDVVTLGKSVAIVLVPVAVEMLYESYTVRNLFYVLTDVPLAVEVREGRVRANGAFSHAILAGTVGAVMLPLMIGIRRYSKRIATIGAVACVVMVFTSASSSPIVSCACGLAALYMWRFGGSLRWVRWAAVFGYIALDIVMKAPAYYILARIDIAGGSTGWHRARLIQAGIEHFSEWWLIGTDYTRHWIAYGVPWSPNHIDVTNYYLKMGVLGGLPLMLLFIGIVAYSFVFVARGLAGSEQIRDQRGFVLWSLGSAMFAHATTSIAVTYFDHSFLFFFLVPAAIASSAYSLQTSGVENAHVPKPMDPKMPRVLEARNSAESMLPANRRAFFRVTRR